MKKWSLGIVLTLMLALLAGCITADPKPPTPPAPPVEKVTLVTYVPNQDFSGLVPMEITLEKGQDLPLRVLQKAVEINMQEKYAAIPKGTKVLSVTVNPENGIATADFSKELKENIGGGSLSELLVAYITANTLTNLEGIKAVQFKIEGKTVDTLNGHLDFSEPIQRNEEFIIQKG